MDTTLVIVLAALALIMAFHRRSHLLIVLLCCSAGLLMLPVIGAVLTTFWLYRRYALHRLSKRPGFVGLMDGMDAYWAQERTTSNPVINILTFIEFTPEESKGDLTTMAKDRALSLINKHFKLKCKRMLSEFGYYYWEEQSVDLDEQVRWMDLEEITEESLKEYMSRIANAPLPYGNRAVWEVLVGRKSLEMDGKKVFPIVERFHHSVADGISLVNMFLTGCTDEGSELSIQKSVEQKVMSRISAEVESRLGNGGNLSGLMQRIGLLMLAPVVLVSQLLTPKDDNVLHRKLSGEKHVLWVTVNDSLAKIRKLKQELNCTFFDIGLLALSDSFEKFFKKSGKPPMDMTLLAPARLPVGDDRNVDNLSNRFTMIAVKLPISGDRKLETIRIRTRNLPFEPHYIVNYWIMKIAYAFLPVGLVRKNFWYRKPTLILSNIPGPVGCAHMDGYPITDAIFWVPNIDAIGVGISMLSYNGKLTFTAHIDKACIAEKEEVEAILNGIISSIDNMHESIFS